MTRENHESDQPFRYLLRVRYDECDAQKVVFNARYGTYIDLAVTEFVRAMGLGDVLVNGSLDYQLVKQTIEWKARPLRSSAGDRGHGEELGQYVVHVDRRFSRRRPAVRHCDGGDGVRAGRCADALKVPVARSSATARSSWARPASWSITLTLPYGEWQTGVRRRLWKHEIAARHFRYLFAIPQMARLSSSIRRSADPPKLGRIGQLKSH